MTLPTTIRICTCGEPMREERVEAAGRALTFKRCRCGQQADHRLAPSRAARARLAGVMAVSRELGVMT